MNNLINMLLQQNPQLQTLMQQFSNPNVAKQKVIELINSGQISDKDIQQIRNFSKQFGLENQVNSALSELNLNQTKPKKNRW